jgi:nicotinamide riboside kinase
MAIKIGLCGTHNSGKTSLAGELFRSLPNCRINGSVARTSGLPLNRKSNLTAQIWIVSTRVAREMEQENKEPQFLVCERTTLDDYAYLEYLIEKGREGVLDYSQTIHIGSKEYALDEFWSRRDAAFSFAKQWMKTYDMIFYLGPVKLVADGVRSTDDRYQLDIDTIIRRLLSEWSIPFESITDSRLEDRLAKVHGIISEKTRLR